MGSFYCCLSKLLFGKCSVLNFWTKVWNKETRSMKYRIKHGKGNSALPLHFWTIVFPFHALFITLFFWFSVMHGIFFCIMQCFKLLSLLIYLPIKTNLSFLVNCFSSRLNIWASRNSSAAWFPPKAWSVLEFSQSIAWEWTRYFCCHRLFLFLLRFLPLSHSWRE